MCVHSSDSSFIVNGSWDFKIWEFLGKFPDFWDPIVPYTLANVYIPDSCMHVMFSEILKYENSEETEDFGRQCTHKT